MLLETVFLLHSEFIGVALFDYNNCQTTETT